MRCRTKALRPARNSSTNRFDPVGDTDSWRDGAHLEKHARPLSDFFKSRAALWKMPPLWISPLKNALGYPQRLGKSSAKNAPLLPHLPQRRRRRISHSFSLFFSSISSWTYYKVTLRLGGAAVP